MPRVVPEIAMPFIRLDNQVKKPQYRQLYECISNAVITGVLKTGDRMPSTRQLAQQLKISRNSVIMAYDQLLLEGFIGSNAGAGTFVCQTIADQKIRGFKASKESDAIMPFVHEVNSFPGDKHLSHDSGFEPLKPFQTQIPALDEFPFSVWSKIAANVFNELWGFHLGYDQTLGYLPLRHEIANYLRVNRSINCTADQIVIVNGARQAIHLIVEMFTTSGDEVWMEDPGFGVAKAAFERNNVTIRPVPIRENGLDINYAIKNYPAAKFAFVTPSHQYPMGVTMPLKQRLQLLEQAQETGKIIIEDDSDSEFRYNSRPFPALKAIDTKGHVIYVGTFSKILFPALRVGYVLLPNETLAQKFAAYKSVTDRQHPITEQVILHRFIKEGHLARHLRKMRVLYKKKQEDLNDLLRKHIGSSIVTFPVDAGLNFIIRFQDQTHYAMLKEQAPKQGIILLPVDDLAIQFKHERDFLVGFSGFKFDEMEKGVLTIKKILNGQ